jgi:hypothetical protein
MALGLPNAILNSMKFRLNNLAKKAGKEESHPFS